MDTVGERIRKRRLEFGWSQEQLAERARLSRNTISEAERGVKDPQSIDTLCKLANALEVNLYYLVSDDDLKLLDENPADLALRKFCDPLRTVEKVEHMNHIIEAVFKYYSLKK